MSRDGELPRGLIGRRGTPTGKNARLPSMQKPRDLTLGGKPKKTFVPNIPVRRDRSQQDATSSAASTSEVQHDRGGKSGRGRGERGRGRGRGASNIIQSHSIFEQGPTQQANKQKEAYERVERGSSSSAGSRSVKRDKPQTEESKRVIDELLRDDFIDDGDDLDTDNMPPIYLPMSAVKNEIKAEVKAEVKGEIKREKMDLDVEDVTDFPTIDKRTAAERREQMTCNRLFSDHSKSDVGGMMFIQLPDTLPGLILTDDDVTAKPTDTKSTKDVTKALKLCKLSDFSEGHIGKLRIRASGKTELVLGDTVLDVNMGTPCAFLQDVVCIRTGTEEGDNLSVLAHIDNKVVCTPNFDALLEECRKQE